MGRRSAALSLFLIAFGVRWWLRQGLVLGDDPQEYASMLHILDHGPLLQDQLHLRFTGWVLNVLAFRLGGISETTYILPTMLVTSTFGVIAYRLLLGWGYGPGAWWGGLLVAVAPFEVLLGTLRANDSYLEACVALGFLANLTLRPIAKGLALAVLFWLAFYVKVWALFFLPLIVIGWAVGRCWQELRAFVATSLLLHVLTCLVWWHALGTPIPFITNHAVNYVVRDWEFWRVLSLYPHYLFVGSLEFGTTLWGLVPWALGVLLLVKAWTRLWDRADWLLLGCWLPFLLCVEFVPASFVWDHFYSVPRIWRYLAPASFPLTLHLAKALLDLPVDRPTMALTVALSLAQAGMATDPGRTYHHDLQAVLTDLRTLQPPAVLAEATVASYMRDLYGIPAVTIPVMPDFDYGAPAYERWFHDHEADFPVGTILVTGLGSFVHYGAHIDGFRLAWWEHGLPPWWVLVKTYPILTYLPRPEAARLWRLE